MTEYTPIPLPEKLARYVDSEKLRLNAANTPTMQRELTEGEAQAVEAVKELLLGVDLSHGTPKQIPNIDEVGILPSAQLPGGRSNTLPLDQSIGLDEYAFMHWGAFHRSANYGRYSYVIDTRSVLLSERTIVTPFDIADTVFDGRGGDFGDLAGREAQDAQEYLDSMVTGTDWLELVARRTLSQMRSAKEDDTYRIRSAKIFGEIKHLGAIEPSAVKGVVGPMQEEDKWKEILENGFAVEPVHNALQSVEWYGTVANGYDKLPHQLDADMEKPKKIWATILEMANS